MMNERARERLRKHAEHYVRSSSVREVARRMGVSHYALSCFLDRRRKVRTRRSTLFRIEQGLEWFTFDLRTVRRDVRAMLFYLCPELEIVEVDAFVESILNLVKARRDQLARQSRSSRVPG